MLTRLLIRFEGVASFLKPSGLRNSDCHCCWIFLRSWSICSLRMSLRMEISSKLRYVEKSVEWLFMI